MKNIKLYIATSLDGYIARSDGNLDWLLRYPMPTGTEYGYKDLMDSIDVVIMGGRTYREMLCMDIVWPYKDKKTYVVSHHSMETEENIEFITENIIEKIADLRNEEGKDIWLVGGGELITMLLNADLVDELQISYIPIILGEGIQLFPNRPKGSNWKLIGSTSYDSGIVKTDYLIAKLN